MRLLPHLQETPEHAVRLSYNRVADVLCINYRKLGIATDSEMTDKDIIVHYDGDEVIGMTILRASSRD